MRLIIITLLIILLASCAPLVKPIPTETSVFTSTFTTTPIPSFTSTPIPATATQKTLLPTQLTLQASHPTIVVITPEPDQLEKWQEYEDALGKRLFKRESLEHEILCEWEILGQSDREVYVWAFCMVTTPFGETGNFPFKSLPALIRLDEDNDIQEIELPGAGTLYGQRIREIFPLDVQERIFRDFHDVRRFESHIMYRIEHPEEPPLIVLTSTPVP